MQEQLVGSRAANLFSLSMAASMHTQRYNMQFSIQKSILWQWD